MLKSIKQTVILSLFTVVGFTAMPAQSKLDVELIKTSDCFSGTFASYDRWIKKLTDKVSDEPGSEKRLKNMKELFKKEDFESYRENIECKNIVYKVNDAVVTGYYVAPKAQSKLPVIINNRGGNGRYGAWVFGNVYLQLFDLAENENVAIFASNYRGVHPKLPGKDEFGGADVNDVVALPQLFKHFPNVNPEKVGMYGASRGGMQSLLAVKNGLDVDAR